MGKLKKKGESGEATNFISRNQAVRMLQVSLADFRRLCILKGIYPREPKNKKKINKGNTANKTYYFIKDIRYLAHEPLLAKFREFKVYLRRVKRAQAKDQAGILQNLEDAKPVFRYDHIVKERYPTFVDALRDLDDALCLMHLFAQLPQTDKVNGPVIAQCKRLVDEFTSYVVLSKSLRKTFLSIKGIYYQAEVQGQTITWITPYKFNSEIPIDVDFRVMGTFVQFYTTLLNFVNWRLYNSLGLVYPPQLDPARDAEDAGLTALVMAKDGQGVDLDKEGAASRKGKQEEAKSKKESEKNIKKALKSIQKITDEMDTEEDAGAVEEDGEELDEFPEQMEGGEESVPNLASLKSQAKSLEAFTGLFANCYFFIGRECPRYSLEFVIRAFGGHVGWESTGGIQGGDYGVGDARITHHIADRPKVPDMVDGRHYVQPQWVYDCVNMKRLVHTAEYVCGAVLPPHLSPFVEEAEDDYMPPERRAQLAAAASSEQQEGEFPEDDGEEEDGEKDEEEEEEEEDLSDGELYRKEFEEELKGKSLAQSFVAGISDLKSKKKGKAPPKKSAEDLQASEEKKLAKMMMSKKDKRLYEQIMFSKKKKEMENKKLSRKREEYEESQAAAAAPAPSATKKSKKGK